MHENVNIPILRLLLSKAEGRQGFWKASKPCHVGIHCIALAEHSQMSTHLPVFPVIFKVFLHDFVLAKKVMTGGHRSLTAWRSPNHRLPASTQIAGLVNNNTAATGEWLLAFLPGIRAGFKIINPYGRVVDKAKKKMLFVSCNGWEKNKVGRLVKKMFLHNFFWSKMCVSCMFYVDWEFGGQKKL